MADVAATVFIIGAHPERQPRPGAPSVATGRRYQYKPAGLVQQPRLLAHLIIHSSTYAGVHSCLRSLFICSKVATSTKIGVSCKVSRPRYQKRWTSAPKPSPYNWLKAPRSTGRGAAVLSAICIATWQRVSHEHNDARRSE